MRHTENKKDETIQFDHKSRTRAACKRKRCQHHNDGSLSIVFNTYYDVLFGFRGW